MSEEKYTLEDILSEIKTQNELANEDEELKLELYYPGTDIC
ncbi:hypothetical protein ACTQ5K_23935 [Niallia sp. Sow4_A1]|nr:MULTISPECIES: hypothetical protein [Bacillaceae]CAI9396716.1 hypothetical protein BACSP_04375 [Bacillus sp. T2.9-1]